MDIWTTESIQLVILFVIPGFISLKVYTLLAGSDGKHTSQQLLDAIAYSCINYAAMAFPILWIEKQNLISSHPKIYFAIWSSILLIVPGLLSLGYWKLRQTEWSLRVLPHPQGRAWDYVFSKRLPAWIVITLKDGRKVGGWYGGKSFASSNPNLPEIYIQEEYHINEDGGFDSPHHESGGILITESEISTIHFYQPDWSNNNERKETHK